MEPGAAPAEAPQGPPRGLRVTPPRPCENKGAFGSLGVRSQRFVECILVLVPRKAFPALKQHPVLATQPSRLSAAGGGLGLPILSLALSSSPGCSPDVGRPPWSEEGQLRAVSPAPEAETEARDERGPGHALLVCGTYRCWCDLPPLEGAVLEQGPPIHLCTLIPKLRLGA